jgi:tellurite resistance protein TerC
MGAAIVNEFTWVLFIFAAFLIFTGWKMIAGGDHEMDLNKNPVLKFLRKRMRITDTIENHNFFVKKPDPKGSGRLVLFATPLFLALVMVEVVDVIFAIDSVPAIFAVTKDPFIVYTSNIFAILGLRSMYFMLAEAVARFKYLKYGLSLVLVLKDATGTALVPYLEPQWSLIATVALIAGSMLYSWMRTSGKTPESSPGNP